MVKTKLAYLDNYEEFSVFADKLTEKKKHVYFMFTGKKKENGRSWCIFCQLGLFICSFWLVYSDALFKFSLKYEHILDPIKFLCLFT